MKVVDAGVIVALVAGGLDPDRLGSEDLAAPHLLDSEVTHVLRGLVLRGALTGEQAALAMGGFGLPVVAEQQRTLSAIIAGEIMALAFVAV